MSQFRGRTEEASAPFLKAEFWEKGRSISGTVVREFTTENGRCYAIHLNSPLMVDGKSERQVSIGNGAGFRMALQAAGLPEAKLLAGDQIHLECTGFSETTKGNDQVNFSIEVNRPDSAERAARA